jgi:hypothetical protein
MGRRLSADKTPRKAGRKGSEGQVDYPNKQAAGYGTSGETQTSPRSTLTPQKRYPSISEHDTPPEASDSLSSFYLASASSSSSELAQQMSPRDIWSPSRSSQIDRLDSTAKSLLSSTGRALMRHASKLSVASSISHDRDEEGKVVWKLSGLGDSAVHSKSWRSKMLYCVLFFFPLTLEQKICGRGQYQRPLISNMSRIPIESKFKVLKGQAKMSSYPSLVLFELANERIQNSEASKLRICWPKRRHHHLTKQNQSLHHLT